MFVLCRTNFQCNDEVGELPFATWNVVRSCVKDVLAGKFAQCLLSLASTVPLSNIKRICLTQYNTELSEMALGRSKFSELPQDVRLSVTCTVKLFD